MSMSRRIVPGSLSATLTFFLLATASVAAGPDWGAPGGVMAPARPAKLQAVEPKTAPAAAETVLKIQRFTLDGKHSTESVPFQVPGPGKVILEATPLYPLNQMGLVVRGADPKVPALRKDGPTPLRLEFTVTAQTLANWSVPTKPALAGPSPGASPPVTTAPLGYNWKVDTTILGTNGMAYAIPGSAVVDLRVSFVPDAPAKKTALEPKANPNLGAAAQPTSGTATGKS